MQVLGLDLRLRLTEAQSLKEKRSAVRPILDRLKNLGVSVSEVGHNDDIKNARIGVAVVAGSPRQATEVMDEAERVVWTLPGFDVVSADRTWMEIDR